MSDDEKLEIRLEADAENRTLTIIDNGIGMNRAEVKANIGTIARSGSRELMEKLRKSKSEKNVSELIGQFGVGFYSSFMAADRVTLLTRRAGKKAATHWESTGDGQYSLTSAQRDGHGTTITLHLKDVDKDAGIEDYTDPWVLSRIVKRYSDFVSYPIMHKTSREETETDEVGMPKKDGKTSTVVEDKTLNSMKPIWTRPRSEVERRGVRGVLPAHFARLERAARTRSRCNAEGRIEYQALLFLPVQGALRPLLLRRPVLRPPALCAADPDHGSLRGAATAATCDS